MLAAFTETATIGSPLLPYRRTPGFQQGILFPSLPCSRVWSCDQVLANRIQVKGFVGQLAQGLCLLHFLALPSFCCLEHEYHSRSSNLCLAAFSRFSKNKSQKEPGYLRTSWNKMAIPALDCLCLEFYIKQKKTTLRQIILGFYYWQWLLILTNTKNNVNSIY